MPAAPTVKCFQPLSINTAAHNEVCMTNVVLLIAYATGLQAFDDDSTRQHLIRYFHCLVHVA